MSEATPLPGELPEFVKDFVNAVGWALSELQAGKCNEEECLAEIALALEVFPDHPGPGRAALSPNHGNDCRCCADWRKTIEVWNDMTKAGEAKLDNIQNDLDHIETFYAELCAFIVNGDHKKLIEKKTAARIGLMAEDEVTRLRARANGEVRVQVRGDEHLCWDGTFEMFRDLQPFRCEECETRFDAADLLDFASVYVRPVLSNGDLPGDGQ